MGGKNIWCVILLALAACNTKQGNQSEGNNPISVEEGKAIDSVASENLPKQPPAKTDTALTRTFLSLFKPINPKGYHAFSPEFNGNMEVVTPQFKGVPIDAKKFQGLLKEDVVPYRESIMKGYGGIFAIGKFDINEQYTGLVVRQHSQYSNTQISLLLWDKQKHDLVKGLELADNYGDAGWFFDTESWITDFQQNEELEIVTRTKDFNPNEDFTSGTVTDSLKISRFNRGRFITANATSLDTSKFKLKRWKQ